MPSSETTIVCQYIDYVSGERCKGVAEKGLVGDGRCFECMKPVCDEHLLTCPGCDQGVCPHCYDTSHGDNCHD